MQAKDATSLWRDAQEELKKTETEILSQHAITVFPVLCDVVNRDHVENMVSDAETEDSIDILVNNTGSHGASSFLDN